MRRTIWCAVWSMWLGCSGVENLEPSPLLSEGTGGLSKGTPGAQNGDLDYCADPGTPCLGGEGDCDASYECAGELECGVDNGERFGFSAGHDICVPSHCTNLAIDAGSGETGLDCGGPCGHCSITCTGSNGDPAFCTPGCPCESGGGDCDADDECATGLVCGEGLGPQFAMPTGHDVCVPSHCVNGVLDAGQGELSADCGGACGATGCTLCEAGTPGAANACSVECPCAAGVGDCDSDDDCAGELVCGEDNGEAFAIGDGMDVCVPLHCTNFALDADSGETDADCGGPCGACPECAGVPDEAAFCTAACPCTSGAGDCDTDDDCVGNLVCAADLGPQFELPPSWDVCAPAHCVNGLEEAGLGENGVDCGGPCGACPSACSGQNGEGGFCTPACPCGSGEGDCDTDGDCAEGLVCGDDNGPQYLMPVGHDVCVSAACANGLLNAGEDGVDCGGSCGECLYCTGSSGDVDYCDAFCACENGQGDCDLDSECASGLVCGTDNGPQFDMPEGHDACVPAHCTNGIKDSGDGETGPDCGGPCGVCTNCDDDNPCTVDEATPEGCINTPIPGCCTLDEHCPSEEPCTVGSCVNNVCSFTSSSPAECCLAGGWTRPLGKLMDSAANNHIGRAVVPRPGGGYVVVGVQDYDSFWSFMWGAGLSPSGDLLFDKRLYNYDRAAGIGAATLATGDTVVAVGYGDSYGYKESYPWSSANYWGSAITRAVGADGNVGAFSDGATAGRRALAVAADPAGGAVIVGHRHYNDGTGAAGDLWVTRVSASGTTEWSEYAAFDSGGYEGAVDVIVRDDGDAVVLGWQRTCPGGSCSPRDPRVLELDPAGATVWDVVVPVAGDDQPTSITLLASGVAAFASHSSGDSTLIGLSPTGSTAWQTLIGGVVIHSVAATPDGAVALAGEKAGGWWLGLATDSGTLQWEKTYSFEAGAAYDVLPLETGFALTGKTGDYGRLTVTDALGGYVCELDL